NSLSGKNFDSSEICKNYLKQFVAQKIGNFYINGIVELPQRWQKVIDKYSAYIDE
ncbi:hypothetical protein X777_10203, partial [Ooceraea biroi]